MSGEDQAIPPAEAPETPKAPKTEEAKKASKGVGTRLRLSNYIGLAGALAAMIALFSALSSHFLTYDMFSTIANQIPDLVVMSVGSVLALKWGWSALLGVAAAALTGTMTGLVTVA